MAIHGDYNRNNLLNVDLLQYYKSRNVNPLPVDEINGSDQNYGFTSANDYNVNYATPDVSGGSTGFYGQRNSDGSPAVVGANLCIDPMRYYS